ncbi:hypothetical protein BGZ47_008021 [Haplosporangium gracile]|nr:hypothetical protein BGZ47_008021 [Haplosporangium gracile]
MKVPTILPVLATITLANPIHAAPLLHSRTPPPSPINGTFTDDDADSLSRVIKYNYESDAELAALYNKTMSSTLSQSNAVSTAALTCDGSGFTTLWTITAHSNKEAIMPSKPMCIALSTINPHRSMFFPGKTSCKGGKWDTDFVFYESTQVLSTNELWRANYPRQSRTLRTDFNSHLAVLKKPKVPAPPDAATARRAEMLVMSSLTGGIPSKDRYTQLGKGLTEYPNLAFSVTCNNLVSPLSAVVRRVFTNGFGSIQLKINKVTIAAIPMKVGHSMPASYVNRALFLRV